MVRYWMFRVLAAGWMGLIFLLSSRPDLPTLDLFWQPDKLLHMAVFGILGVLLAGSLDPPGVTTWARVILVSVLVLAYGISDEYHQSFVPGRDASLGDVLADGAGGLLAALMLFWRSRRAGDPSPGCLSGQEKS